MPTEESRTTASDFDQTVARQLGDASQRMSRRSLLGKLGKVVLGAAGFALVDVATPVRFALADDPVEDVENLLAPCSGWFLCGLTGTKCCAAHCPQGATVHSCPACSREGGCWTKCCRSPSGEDIEVAYCDCYKDNCTTAQRDNCDGRCPTCLRGGLDVNYYNGSSTYYMCTASRILLPC